MSRRVVAESLAQPLADERREADLAGLSGHEAAPCDWSGSQGHAGARKTRMCTAGGALVIVAYAEQFWGHLWRRFATPLLICRVIWVPCVRVGWAGTLAALQGPLLGENAALLCYFRCRA